MAIPALDLNGSDEIRLADIGGGTGGLAETIYKLSGNKITYHSSHHYYVVRLHYYRFHYFYNWIGNLKNPIGVVDPSQGLLQRAKNRSNMLAIQGTADDFFNSDESKHYNRILMSQCVHHFPDQKATFQSMYDKLPNGSICVIVSASKTTLLPLWKSIRQNFGSYMIDEVENLKSCGFDVELFSHNLPFHITKKRWYKKIRDRMFSSFSSLSDEEIERGIDEIERTLLYNVMQDDVIDMKHTVQVIAASKP